MKGSTTTVLWRLWFLVFGFWLAPSLLAFASPPDLVVLGDSLSTGAATHPALAFDGKVLWDVFTGALPVAPRAADLPADLTAGRGDPLPPPVRLWPTSREFFGGPDWVWRNALQSLSRSYLDTAEYSWGYMLGLSLGLKPEQIALAGEDGARVETLPRHVDRVLKAGDGTLPRRVFIFYTGNDLCAMGMGGVTTGEEFEANLTSGLHYLMHNGRAAAGGTDVYVVGYLSVLQLLTADDILAKKVRAFGGEMSCRDLRANGYRPRDAEAAVTALPPDAWWFSVFMPPNPAGFCPTLFGPPGEGREEEVGALANRIRAYRESQQQVVGRLAAEASSASGLRFHYVPGTTELTFTGDDVALDCFHLSVAGQAKVARAVLSAVRSVDAASGAPDRLGGGGG